MTKKKQLLTVIKNLGFEEKKTNEELDKFHRLQKAKDRKQSTIIRFKSDSFGASAYASRSNTQNREKNKTQIIINKTQIIIINYAYTITELVPGVKFAYVDVNGNLKIPST